MAVKTGLNTREWLWPALLLPACLIFFWPLIFGGKVLYEGDFLAQVYPDFHWLHEKLSRGLVPFWCQDILLGHPFLDEGQSAYFYLPLRWILTVFDALQAVPLTLFLHTFWLGLGTYFFVRLEGFRPGLALLSALGACFAGPTMEFWIFNDLAPLAWLPWQFCGAALILEGPLPRRLAGSGLLGLAAGLSLLSGQPFLSLYGLAALALYFLARLAAKKKPFSRAVWTPALGSGLVALCLCGGQVYLTWNYVKQSVRREAYAVEQAGETALSPASLAQVLAPKLFGISKDNSFLGMSWKGGTWAPQGNLVYLGILALLLAFLGLKYDPARCAPFFAAAGLLFIYSLGGHTPVFKWFQHLPLLGHNRSPLKALCHLGFLMAVPVAAGGRSLLEDGKSRRTAVFFLLGLALLFLSGYAFLLLEQSRILAQGEAFVRTRVLGTPLHVFSADYYMGKLDRWMACLRGHLAGQGLRALAGAACLAPAFYFSKKGKANLAAAVLGLGLFFDLAGNFAHDKGLAGFEIYARRPRVCVELNSRAPGECVVNWGYYDLFRESYPQGKNESQWRQELKLAELLPANCNLLWGIRGARGYAAVGLERVAAVFGDVYDNLPGMDMKKASENLAGRRGFFEAAGVKTWISTEDFSALSGFKRLTRGRVSLYRDLRGRDAAYFAGKVKAVPGRDEAVKAAREYAFSPEAAIVEGDPPQGLGPENPADQVKMVSLKDEEWMVSTRAAKPRLLVLAKAWYEGSWLAEVDGHEASLRPVDACLTGLVVPAGQHRVRVFYHSPWFEAFRWAFRLGLALGLGLLLVGMVGFKAGKAVGA